MNYISSVLGEISGLNHSIGSNLQLVYGIEYTHTIRQTLNFTSYSLVLIITDWDLQLFSSGHADLQEQILKKGL